MINKCSTCVTEFQLYTFPCLFQVYLSLPAGVSMAEGHCLICPLQHHSCATALDEDVWSEIQVTAAPTSLSRKDLFGYLLLELTLCFLLFPSCFAVRLCACLSPRTWTVCLWKRTFTHVNRNTWSLNVSHYPENWETWLQFILRS